MTGSQVRTRSSFLSGILPVVEAAVRHREQNVEKKSRQTWVASREANLAEVLSGLNRIGIERNI
jgi:hypothetical protein